MQEIPLQDNTYDCGVFVMKYAQAISEEASSWFSEVCYQYHAVKMLVVDVNKNPFIHYFICSYPNIQ